MTSEAETHSCAVKASFSGDDAVWAEADRGSSAEVPVNSVIELGSSADELGCSVTEKVFSVSEEVFSEGERPGPSWKREVP